MNPSPRFLHLLSRLTDGLLDPEESAELDGLLLGDKEARDYYRCHVAVHSSLEQLPVDDKVVAFPPRRRWVMPAAAAAAVLLAAGATWWLGSRDRGGARDLRADKPKAEPILAVTSAAHDLRWSLESYPESGVSLQAGIVHLYAGDLSLSLAGGQLVHLKAPGEFELLEGGEFALRKGAAAFRTIDGKGPFIVHLPKAALVDTGSDYAVEVDDSGVGEVRVFEQSITVSTLGPSGRTQEEQELLPGRSLLVANKLSPGSRPAEGFLRVPPAPLAIPSGGADAYAAAIRASSPTAYWRFEETDSQGIVSDEAGDHPLRLVGKARLSGDQHQHFLLTNKSDASGFAIPAEGITGLDTARGLTLECLLYSASEEYGTAIALEDAEARSLPPGEPTHLGHAPQSFALERMGRKGEHIGHIHPDFALRAMFRSPAGYRGGTNTYSSESHLLHRWIHVAVVNDGERICLYVDGKLSDSAQVALSFRDAKLRPIIGRLQPNPKDELRQWVGGIDEVALYGRALPVEEIRRHAEMLKPSR